MTEITCDLCGKECTHKAVKVTFKNGEHPHNGSTMTSTVDVCMGCIVNTKLELESSLELDAAKDVVK